jgi:hypothetical protein
MKHIFLLFLSVVAISPFMGQLKITQIHLNSGNHLTFFSPNTSLSNFNELAPNSTILG